MVKTAARHTARHSTHSTDRWLHKSGQVSLKNRCPLACMGLHKAAWGQVVLRYIYVLVCCCKQLDAYTYTACQGICINIKTLLKSFLTIYLIIHLSYISLVTLQLEHRRATFHLLLGAKLIIPLGKPDPD